MAGLFASSSSHSVDRGALLDGRSALLDGRSALLDGRSALLDGRSALVIGPFAVLSECVRAGIPAVLATVVEVAGAAPLGAGDGPLPTLGATLLVRTDGATVGSLGNRDLDEAVVVDARRALDANRGSTMHYGARGETRLDDISVFLDPYAPPHQMVILGAVDFTGALVRVAKVLGYRVTVCDARPAFATTARFPEADEVVVDWPHRYLEAIGTRLGARDAVCVLTHDHKFDVPALMVALDSQVGYIGAMGSRGTHAGRVERLRHEGASNAQLARIMAPIGVDIGARTPEETAISICAELIALQSGTRAPSLRDGSGPIHRARAV